MGRPQPLPNKSSSFVYFKFAIICISNLSVYGFLWTKSTLPIYIEQFEEQQDRRTCFDLFDPGSNYLRPFTGWGVDKYGRRLFLIIGLLLFLLPSLVLSI